MAEELTRRELLRKALPARELLSPPGLSLDRTLCSGCGLCARDCPEEAITISIEPRLQLCFESDRCNGCGVCVEMCPEKCLKLVAGSRETARAVLFETDMLRCERCGDDVGPKAMIEQIRARLGEAAAGILLCPSCKGAIRG